MRVDGGRGPAVKAREREGFGSLLIRESARALGSVLKSEFREKGFGCSLSFVFNGESEGGLRHELLLRVFEWIVLQLF